MIKSIRKKVPFIIFIGLFFFGGVFAQTGVKRFFHQGNEAYASGDYQKALEWYHQIEAMGLESSELYYNIGNCYFKLNELGKAILYYEKALKLDPHDPDIKHNREFASTRVVDRIELPPRFVLFKWWDSLVSLFTINQLAKISAFSYLAFVVFLVVYLFLRHSWWRKLLFIMLVVSFVCIVLSSFLLYVNVKRAEQEEAVVLSSVVTVYSAPDENSTNMFVLHEGVKVELDEHRSGWVKITLPDGKSGWLKEDVLGVI